MIIPGNSIVASQPKNLISPWDLKHNLEHESEQENINNIFDVINDKYGTTFTRDNTDGKKTFSDYNGDWKSYLQDLVDKGDAEAADKLLNYLMSEDSAQKQRDWESTSYQRLVNDLKAAGINPYILLNSGASPISSSSSNSYSGSQFTTRLANKETARHNQQTESLNILKAILMTIPFIVALAAI